ncbi:sodium-coupled monocarboxylate transporter 2 [Caerostris extrusa]|uniref:Sodium-coupled monocarboxylate transporter 2 n=1 Tax=Caerostris extrusa TaxID=172846 RepID=A0AAV4TBX5_CAEEX|nr:sodium-coupled monocarboxylate transporter 2 [Caerostris extrusa]
MYMPVVLYAPALALSEDLSDLVDFDACYRVKRVWFWNPAIDTDRKRASDDHWYRNMDCSFVDRIGLHVLHQHRGMKAVVWTDLFQALLMYASILVILVKGTIDLVGSTFDFDPTVRHTFWGLVIGGYILWMGQFSANQALIQRYLAVGSLREAQWSLWINLPALVLLIGMTSMSGLVIYAYYWECDPIGTKLIQSPDQVTNFIIRNVSLHIVKKVCGKHVSNVKQFLCDIIIINLSSRCKETSAFVCPHRETRSAEMANSGNGFHYNIVVSWSG